MDRTRLAQCADGGKRGHAEHRATQSMPPFPPALQRGGARDWMRGGVAVVYRRGAPGSRVSSGEAYITWER